MSKITVQQVYRVILSIMAFISFILAIPTVYETIAKSNAQTYLIILTIVYVILLFIASLNFITHSPTLFLWVGVFTFAYTPVLVLSTFINGLLTYGLIRFVIKDFKREKKEQEQAKKMKEKRRKTGEKEPTVFDVFGQEYTYDDEDD